MASDPFAKRVSLGAMAHREGRLDDAEAAYRAVLAASPRQVDALYLLGMLVGQRGASGEATALLERALALAPGRTAVRLGLVPQLLRAGRVSDALTHAERAVAEAPAQAPAHHALGDARLAAGETLAAVESYLAAAQLDPTRRASFENAGVALRDLGLLGDATWCFAEAGRRGPPSAPLLANLAGLVKDAGRIDEALARYREALALEPSLPGLASNLLYAMHYADGATPAEVFEAHATLGATLGAASDGGLAGAPHEGSTVGAALDPCAASAETGLGGAAPMAARPLRVGYVSPDIRQHSVAYFLEPVLAHHEGVEVFVYADVPRPDAVTERVRAMVPSGFRSVVGLDDAQVRALVLADGIDVLVDLAGHTANHRLGVFGARAARTQVTWLGYPGSTGVKAMDFRLTDAEADPPGHEAFATETLVRLPSGFLCYQPPSDAPDVAPSPAGLDGPLTFGSFNQLAKLSASTLALWARVMEAVPRSRLFLKARGLGDPGTVEAFRARLDASGIDVARVEFAGQQRDGRAHLDSYGRLDVALDPFPYNGTTTTCEALWMGVPTLVREGDRHASRVGLSLLTRVGLPLVARTDDEYVAMAVALDADRGALASLRASLRARVAASPLCDARAFTDALQDAYRRMHARADL